METDFESPIRKYFTIPHVIIAVLNIASNSFLIHALRKRNMLRNISFKLVTVLSVSDTLVGVFLLATEIAFRMLSTRREFFILRILTILLLYSACQFSQITIFSIGVDRLIHMKYPLQYHSIVTEKRAKILIAQNLMMTVFHSIACIILFVHDVMFVFFVVISVILITTLLALSIIYFYLFKSMHTRTQPGTPNARRNTNDPSKAVLYILMTLWISIIPLSIFFSMRYRDNFMHNRVIEVGFFTSEMLLFLNSTANVIIFIAFSKSLRKYTWRFLRELIT